MKNYEQVIKKFVYTLTKTNWPKILWVTPGMYWDIIIASEGNIEPDWRFDPRAEDEGFPYFVIGPTMVRCTEPPGRENAIKVTEFPTMDRKERFIEEWEANDSVQPEFKEKIKEMVEDGDLRVETFEHKGEEDERIESEETPENGVRTEEGLDEGGVLPEPSPSPDVHRDDDVSEADPEVDPSGSGHRDGEGNRGERQTARG